MTVRKKVITRDIRNKNVTEGKLSPDVNIGGGATYTLALVYRYSDTRPTKPNGGARTIDGQLTPPTGWEINVPATGSGDLWFSYGIINHESGLIEWTTPNKEANPEPIADLRVRRIYISSASIPLLPTGAGYDPVADELTRISPWSETRPAEPGEGEEIYSSIGIVDTTRSVGNIQWEPPEIPGGRCNCKP